MHQYIDREPGTSADQKAAKHKSLGRETQKLVANLSEKSKLAGTPTLTTQCTRGETIDGGEEPVVDPSTDDPLVEPNRPTN